MKIAVVGKGGVGKTFVAGTLAKQFKKLEPSKMVIAIDADPSTNLYLELGIPQDRARAVTPLCEDTNLVKELTSVGGDESRGAVFNVNQPNYVWAFTLETFGRISDHSIGDNLAAS